MAHLTILITVRTNKREGMLTIDINNIYAWKDFKWNYGLSQNMYVA